MLKRMSIKKIMVSTAAVLLLLIIYLIPDNRKEIELKNKDIEYTYNNITDTIYLIDKNDYVARTNIVSCNCNDIDKAKDLLDSLTIGGKKSNIIPNGFRSIIPPDTSILNIELKDKVLTIDFSKEFLDVSEVEEEKMIESIIYTLTSIKGIDKIIIKVEGNILTNLPHSKKIIPSVLDRSYGINKEYELTTINNIDSYTVYYVNKYNDSNYYVPVTKYINKEEIEPVKVIIKELSSSPIYETNLMSHLNAGVVLNDYELEGNNLKLNFNELLLSNPDSNKILEEVIYTIGLSMNDIYNNLETVSFYVNNNEVYALTLSDLK